MENKKVTLWVIIVLLIILLPITIFSTATHIMRSNAPEENPEHKFKYNGKLYFYDKNELLGTYACENPDEYCDFAVTSVKSDYGLIEKNVTNTKLSLINNRFAFIMDAKTSELANAEIFLYDLTLQKVITKYKEVKNYGVGIENGYYILKNDKDMWGVVAFDNGINLKLPFKYDYIGLANKVNENNLISADIFAVKQDNKWQLVDINGATFISGLDKEIVTYNNEYVVIKDNIYMSLIDYKENIVLNYYKLIDFYNKYLIVIDMSNQFYLYDIAKKQNISETYFVNGIEDINLEINDNKIEIRINDVLKETIAIQ